MPLLPQPTNPVVGNLFQAMNKPSTVGQIQRGSIVVFNYMMWRHDPYPLVLVSSTRPGQGIKGVNLHYLTFPYIKQLLRNSLMFSYSSIKGDKYMVKSFRSYKWNGIRQVKVLDTDFLLRVMGTVRSFDPNQIQAIRESVQEQINRVVNPPAEPTQPTGVLG